MVSRWFDTATGVRPRQELLDLVWVRELTGGMSDELRLQHLTFVYYFADPRSPLYAVSESERQEVILKNVWSLKGFKPDETTEQLVDRYRQLLSRSVAFRLLEAYRSAIDKLIDSLQAVRGESKDLSRVSDLVKAAKDLPALLSKVKDLEKAVLGELSEGDIYGGGSINPFEV